MRLINILAAGALFIGAGTIKAGEMNMHDHDQHMI